MERRLIVERDLFTRMNITQGYKENMTIEYLNIAIGFAGMVYVMSAVSAFAAVDAPMIIDCADTESASPGTPISLRIGDSLAAVLRYLAATREVDF